MAPEGPYRYRSPNMLPVEREIRTEARGDGRFSPGEGRGRGANVVFWTCAEEGEWVADGL